MQSEAVQDRPRLQPLLQELRGKLDVVARHRRARQRGIDDARVQPVQSVAELVEDGARVVPADQDRLAGLALHEVRVVGDDDRDLSLDAGLPPVLVHPRAGGLSRTRVRVEVPESDVLALGVGHLPDPHVRMVDGDGPLRHRHELEAEQLFRHPEHALAQLLQLQVGLHVVLVEVVLRLAHLLRVEAVVPGSDADAGLLPVGDRLHIGDLFVDPRHRRLPHRLHQRHRPPGGLGHRVLEPPVRVRGVPEQPRALRPELQDLHDALVVVVLVSVVAPLDEHAPDLLAQVAPGGVGQEGIDARPRIDDRPLPGLSPRRGRGRRAVAHGLGKPGQVRLLLQEDHLRALLGEHVLAEVGVQPREALVHLRKLRLGGSVELRACADEGGVIEPEEPLLLRRERELCAGRVHRLDAREQLGVLEDPVAELGQLRRHLALDGLHVRVVHGGGVDAVYRRDTVERVARSLHRHDGVLEGGRSGIGRDAVDLGQVLRHGRLQGGLQVGGLEAAERRNAPPGAGPGLEQRLHAGRGSLLGGTGKSGIIGLCRLRRAAAQGGEAGRDCGSPDRGQGDHVPSR